MKLIIGLGNPGNRYEGTRHNVGFKTVDALLERQQLKLTDQKFRADYTIWHHPQDKLVVMKPFTYMNLSGEALLPMMSYFGISMDDILVVYDDLDLEPGTIRLRQNGSAGGHNGMKSLINMLGSKDFKRVRIGIGRPQGGWKVVDHVLAPFHPNELPLIEQAVDQAVEVLEDWAFGTSFLDLMNRYNQKKS